MRRTRIVMGMPITVDICAMSDGRLLDAIFEHFEAVDRRFSTYKSESEISRINRGEVPPGEFSADMREVLNLAQTTWWETDGFFDIRTPSGTLDPSGIVKGWAILKAAEMLRAAGVPDFYVDAGGDIQCSGTNEQGGPWRTGLRHPFNPDAIVKIIYPRGKGVATSGSYERGDHIYDPHRPHANLEGIVSLTVVAADVLEADRYATAAFAMGSEGIGFVESVPGLEGYAIDRDGLATMTSGFEALTAP